MKICLDLETTGLNPTKHDVIQIALVAFDDDFKIVDRFVSDVTTYKPANIDPVALKINQFTLERIKKAPPPMVVKNELHKWWVERQDSIKMEIHGWNVVFDMLFLYKFLTYDLISLMFEYHYIDVYALTRYFIKKGYIKMDGSTSLVNVCSHLEIPHKAHDGFGDCYGTIKVLKHLQENLFW